MNLSKIILDAEEFIRQMYADEASGHDYLHIKRVVTNAQKILVNVTADSDLVILSAWLHDLGDYKLNGGIDKSAELIRQFLEKKNVDEEKINRMITIVSEVSFSKGKKVSSIEAAIVQDADRLDAIGAIGIARCFAFGGSRNRLIYGENEEQKATSSVQHFYDKLLRLKDLMNTETAKHIALKRHQFMEEFLEKLSEEIN